MIDKIFNVLEAISLNSENSINTISRQLNMPRSTVHRIVQGMQQCGVVHYIPHHGYTISVKMKKLCLQSSGNSDFLEATIPLAHSVCEQIGETVSINVLIGLERTCVYRVEGKNPAVRNVRVGDHTPLFIGATGKLFPAYMPPDKYEEALSYARECGIVTNENVIDIMESIEAVRQQGYAVSIEERYPGCWSIGVPIIGMLSGEILGTLTINSLLTTHTEELKKKYLDVLLNAARTAQEMITA